MAIHEALLAAGVKSRLWGRVESNLPPELMANRAPFIQLAKTSIANRMYFAKLRLTHGDVPADFHPVSYGLSPHKSSEFK